MNSNSDAAMNIYDTAIESVAGLLFILQLILLLYFDNFGLNIIILGIGWILLVPSFVLLILPIMTLHTNSNVSEDRSRVDTTSFVKKGIYGIIRHPLYVGWILMSTSLVLISQSLLTTLCGIIIIPLALIIISHEDRCNSMTFGEEYLQYQQEVPLVNIFRGVWRYYRRERTS